MLRKQLYLVKLTFLLLVSEKCLAQRLPSSIWFYNAPAREVPFLPVDTDIQRDLLKLFRLLPAQTRARAFSSLTEESPLDPALVERINELLPQNAIFRGFFPPHQQAGRLLVEAVDEAIDNPQTAPFSFAAVQTSNSSVAAKVLQIMREQLLRNDINAPRVFATFLRRFIHDPDLTGYKLAWAVDVLPDWYITSPVIEQAVANPSVCSPFNGTGGATGRENPLWYFREDSELNQQHWYWHMFFPFSIPNPWDRRGEHFYFFHHNMIARYNAERLSNGLEPEVALDLRQNGDIGEGYNSYLFEKTSGSFFTPRMPHTPLQTVYESGSIYIDINELESVRNDLSSHLSSGFLISPDSSQLDINHTKGVHHVGNVLEGSADNINRMLYLDAGLHNNMHDLIGEISDPYGMLQLALGVMGSPTTAPRDPAFYKVHTLVDEIVDIHKQALEPYQLRGGVWPLVWDGVKIRKLEVEGSKWGQKMKNILNTFWNVKSFPLEQGLLGRIHDGTNKPYVCQQHLDHERFTFKLMVDLEGSEMVKGNVRLFLAPRFNFDGSRSALTCERTQLFQLDVFPVELRPGRNLISRKSSDSSSTRPWSRSLDEMIADPNNGGKPDYCGCGLPEHLYIPKGTKEGMAFDLFAIITNFEDDKVQETEEELNIPEGCNSPYIYCGIPHRKYPDKRPMGYPFDRLPYKVNGLEPETLEEYVMNVPNSFMKTVVIIHEDIVRN